MCVTTWAGVESFSFSFPFFFLLSIHLIVHHPSHDLGIISLAFGKQSKCVAATASIFQIPPCSNYLPTLKWSSNTQKKKERVPASTRFLPPQPSPPPPFQVINKCISTKMRQKQKLPPRLENNRLLISHKRKFYVSFSYLLLIPNTTASNHSPQPR